MIVIGAGVIGLELGSVWRRLGAEVTVVEYLDRILPGADGEIAKQAQRIFTKQGIEFKLGIKVTGVEKLKSKLEAHRCEPAAGGERDTLDADVVLVAIGRRPYTQGPRPRDRRHQARQARLHRQRPLPHRRPTASGSSATSPPARCWRTRPKTKASPAPS